MSKSLLRVLFFGFSLVFSSSVFSADVNNDWMNLFPNIPSISLAEIEDRTEEVVLVDVRPKFEFERQHREGVKHMSFSSRMFMIQMEDLISQNKGKTIVVYCDADNCIKSYRAVEKCRNENMNNVVLFDLKKDMVESSKDKIYTQL